MLLSEGLDLCARARRLDDITGGPDPKGSNSMWPMTRSGTPILWAAEQYEQDLAEWERRARTALAKEHKV